MNEVSTVENKALPAITPMQMLQLAVQQGADLDRLQQLMDLQDRWEANQARKAFVAAMAEFKANPPEIVKEKHVKFVTSKGTTEYIHVTLGKLCAQVISSLAKHGISHRWDVNQDQRIKVTCILTHSAGHSESVSLSSSADDSGGKNSIQAIGSAITYLQRYTLLAATGLAALDADDDGKSSEPVAYITTDQVTVLTDLAKEVGAHKENFLKYLNVDSLEKLTVDKYKKAKTALEAKRVKK